MSYLRPIGSQAWRVAGHQTHLVRQLTVSQPSARSQRIMPVTRDAMGRQNLMHSERRTDQALKGFTHLSQSRAFSTSSSSSLQSTGRPGEGDPAFKRVNEFGTKALISISHATESGTITIREAVGNLPVVNSIRKGLDKNGVVIVQGAPGTGKSEQVEIAVGKHKAFNMKEEFIEHQKEAFQKTHDRPMNNAEENALWGADYYKNKGEESTWLEKNYAQILASLAQAREDVVLLDEIDLDGQEQLSEAGSASAEIMLRLAKDLEAQGKKVIVIVHQVAVETPALLESMKDKGFINESEGIIQTKFFPEESQRAMLKSIGIEGKYAEKFIEYSEGVPAAYLSLLQKAIKEGARAQSELTPDRQLDELALEGSKHLKKLIKVQKKINPVAINFLLEQFKGSSGQHRSFEIEVDNPKLEKILLESGLILRNQDGKLEVPGMVSDALKEEILVQGLDERSALKKSLQIMPIRDLTDINRMIVDQYGGLAKSQSAIFLIRNMGGAQQMRLYGQMVICPEKIYITSWLHNLRKEMMADFLEISRFDEERTTETHMEWRNGAESVSQLHQDAVDLTEDFFKTVGGCCQGRGSFFLKSESTIKTEESMSAKAKRFMKPGLLTETEAIQVINDALRTTVIADNLVELRSTIDQFVKLSKQSGMEVVFSDKNKEMSYPSGYFGVHAKVRMKVPGTDRTMMAEVQFHLKQVCDGTLLSHKEVAHSLYSEIRDVEEGQIEDPLAEGIHETIVMAGMTSHFMTAAARALQQQRSDQAKMK